MLAVVHDQERESVRGRPLELNRATLERCVAGDGAAFQAFVTHYQVAVFALLSRLLGRGPHVEDLAQETFLRAFRALGDFDLSRETRPSTWLLTIGTRLAIDVRRRNCIAQDAVRSMQDGDRERSSPERDSMRAELRAAIQRAVQELPEEQRDVVVLSEFHDFGMAEIAAALGVRENTVKTRLFRARQKLACALAPYREGA